MNRAKGKSQYRRVDNIQTEKSAIAHLQSSQKKAPIPKKSLATTPPPIQWVDIVKKCFTCFL